MQFINTFTTLALLLSIATAAPPVSVNARNSHLYEDGNGQGDGQLKTAQAIYFSTNDPTGNAVITIRVAEDGLLAMGNKFTTGGKGGIGINATTGKPALPDPLFSQDSVRVGDDVRIKFLVLPTIDTNYPNYSSCSLLMLAPILYRCSQSIPLTRLTLLWLASRWTPKESFPSVSHTLRPSSRRV
jgi:hypothetical protein